MANTWSHLLLVFGLAVPLVKASLNATAANNVLTPTTMITMTSTIPIATNSPIDNDPYSVPTASPNLSVISDYKVAAPTPGSFGILNGIPTKILNDTIKQTTPINADTVNAEGAGFYQPWNTSYPGPIHDGDWNKYLQIWDPVWWSTNLDTLRQTSCTCSADDFYTNPQAQLAAFMNFEFYSHTLGTVYSFDWACGPVPSSMAINWRITSGKGKAEHCWSLAGGDFDAASNPKTTNWWCHADEDLCVKPWTDGQRQLKFHGHLRNYDRHGVHTWSETRQVVRDVCEPICKDLFLQNYDDFSHHNPSFVTTFYPPKPIDLTVVGD